MEHVGERRQLRVVARRLLGQVVSCQPQLAEVLRDMVAVDGLEFAGDSAVRVAIDVVEPLRQIGTGRLQLRDVTQCSEARHLAGVPGSQKRLVHMDHPVNRCKAGSPAGLETFEDGRLEQPGQVPLP